MGDRATGVTRLSPAQIRLKREELGLSQRDLAKALRVSPAYIGLLETGARRPSAAFARRLEALGVGRSKDYFSRTSDVVRLGMAGTVDFDFLPPATSTWRANLPFTVIVGPPGSGRTSFAAQWVADLQAAGDATAVWIPMAVVGTDPTLLYETVAEQLPREVVMPSPQDLGREATLAELLNHIERSAQRPVVIGVDDWEPRAGGVHKLVGQLGLSVRKARVIAVTEYIPGAVPGAALVPMPTPDNQDWIHWAESAQVPDHLVADVVERFGNNPLAASYVRHTIVDWAARASAPTNALWQRLVLEVPPAQGRPEWHELLQFCRELLGERVWGLITRVIQASGPVPLMALEQDISHEVANLLLAARFVEPAGPAAPNHVVAHRVLSEHASLGPYAGTSIGIVDESLLSGLESRLLSSSSTEAHTYELQELNRLSSVHLVAHPLLRLALVKRLADRGRNDDLAQARAHIELLLRQNINAGLRWKVLLQGLDLAIRLHEYSSADDLASQLEALSVSSGSAFDRTSLLVMRARAAWEQSRFREALDLLEEGSPQSPADISRVMNWKCRTLGALGNMAEALRAAERGAAIAEREGLKAAEAFSLALAGHIYMLRGTHGQARRALERSIALADEVRELRAKPQALMTLAELDSMLGEAASAKIRIQEAQAALATRSPRVWDGAYSTLCQARVARRSLDSELVSSLAHMCTFEAGVVSSRAPNHPVVATLHVEAAACWAAVGYLYQASKVLAGIDLDIADWPTRIEAEQVRLAVEDPSPDEYVARARRLSAAAADAGCPYLAVNIAHGLAVGARGRWPSVTSRMERWVVEVASARGWRQLAQAGAALIAAPATLAESEHGILIANSDGSRTLIAPRRGQDRARREVRPPLPDPFEE